MNNLRIAGTKVILEAAKKVQKSLIEIPQWNHIGVPTPWCHFAKRAPWTHLVEITLRGNRSEFPIEEDSAAENDFVTGIWVRRATATGRSSSGQTLANDNVFDSAYIEIVDQRDQRIVHKRLPFHIIEKVNVEKGEAFPLFLPAAKLSKSTIKIGNAAGIVDDEILQITLEFFPMPRIENY